MLHEVHDPASLVESNRVHKSVYTNSAIFDLEMERIFRKAWIYAGHESQIRKAGDYVTVRVGKEPVILVRDRGGEIHAFINRCPHKGAKIVGEGCGNTGPLFRCPYHAWTFKHDGSLNGIPHRHGYQGVGVDLKSAEFSMPSVARLESYRGFIFVNLSATGPDLSEFLGGIKSSIDNFCDRSPEGKVEVAGGVFRVMQRSNWKIFFENLNDTAHAQPTHESSYAAARQTVKKKLDGKTPFELHIIEGNGEPNSFWESLELRGYDNGHSYMGAIFKAPQDDTFKTYKEQLDDVYGVERADEILSINRHNTIIYPSCSPHTSFQQLRVIRPISVDRTLVEFYTFRLKGTSKEFWHRTLTYTNVVNSPSSTVMVDDVDLYARCQEGMLAAGNDWISQHRRAGFEQEEGDSRVADGISEFPMRNQFKAWKAYMAD